MDNKRYVFVGNREYVLKEMLSLGLQIQKTWVMDGSFLHSRLLKDSFVDYIVIKDKKKLIQEIIETDFDILISNGCKFILPITQVKKKKERENILFINVHPSFLPDLKGMDPINGACLFNRSGGATCHYMDDGIDTGPIITRIEIPMCDDIDAGLLFQLSFKAEVNAFKKAYKEGFIAQEINMKRDNTIYYTISDDELFLDCNKGVDFLLRQARAFGYRSKGVSLIIGGERYKYYSAVEITNQYITSFFNDIPERVVGIAFEQSVIFKLERRIIRLNQLTIDNALCLEGKTVY